MFEAVSSNAHCSAARAVEERQLRDRTPPDAAGPRAAVVALPEARNHVATACRSMTVSGHRNAAVLHRFVAFLDDVR